MQHANIGYTSAWGNVPNAGLLSEIAGNESMPDELTMPAASSSSWNRG